MIRELARSEVSEFAVVSDRLPCIKVKGAFQPIDDIAPNADTVLEMLVSVGGSRYVDSLSPKPSQWSWRVDGVGTVGVTALIKNNIVQARFVLARREGAAAAEKKSPPTAVQAPAAVPPGPPPARAPVLADAAVLVAPPPPVPAPPAAAAAPVSHAGRGEADPRARGNVAPPPPAAAAPQVARESGRDSDDGKKPASGGREPVGLSTFHDFYGSPSDAPAAAFRDKKRKNAGPAPAPGDAPPASTPEPAASPPSSPPPTTTPGNLEQFGQVVFEWLARGGSGATLGELFVSAREVNASDLHIVAERPVLLRVGGDLVPHGPPFEPHTVETIVTSIVPSRLSSVLAVDGSCDFAVADEHGRCRVNVSRQRTGYKICVRLIPPAVPTLRYLGLPQQIETATHHHQGLILVTGPTGHGKTSTLAAIVDIVNANSTRHIITVEDPVEYIHPRKRALMSQREVGAHTRTFQSALKGALREDPDVIVVGELRDTETVRMALNASETGHLVLGTMNTPSAAKTIDRLIDLFPSSDQAQVRLTLAGGLRMIVSQRLLPNADRSGQVAACEILPGSVSLWSLIRENKTYQIPSLQQRGKGLGITRFDDSLIELVKNGRTSLEIAKQWAENAEELELTVLGKRPPAPAPGAPATKAAPEASKEAPAGMAGILGKAGNLFRKGG
jgi:twitching motility protein PilT